MIPTLRGIRKDELEIVIDKTIGKVEVHGLIRAAH